MCRASRLSVMDGRWDQPVIASRWMGLDGHFADDVVQICDESNWNIVLLAECLPRRCGRCFCRLSTT